MADITIDSTKVALLNNTHSIRLAAFAGEDLSPGDLVYIKSDAKAYKADADGSGTTRCAGLCLEPVKAGNAFSRLVVGGVGVGSALAAIDPDTAVYTSANAGKIANATSTGAVQVGQVMTLTDGKSPTKYLWIDCSKH